MLSDVKVEMVGRGHERFPDNEEGDLCYLTMTLDGKEFECAARVLPENATPKFMAGIFRCFANAIEKASC